MLDRLEVTGAPVKLLDDVETNLSNGVANFSLSPTGTLVFMPAPPRAGRRLVWLDRSGAVDTTPDGHHECLRAPACRPTANVSR